MILDRLDVSVDEFQQRSGWEFKPEGACRGDVCVPLATGMVRDGRVDVAGVAGYLGMPVVHDPGHGVWAVGPAGGGRVLESVRMPDVVLDGFDGRSYDMASARGRKVLLIAWASW